MKDEMQNNFDKGRILGEISIDIGEVKPKSKHFFF